MSLTYSFGQKRQVLSLNEIQLKIITKLKLPLSIIFFIIKILISGKLKEILLFLDADYALVEGRANVRLYCKNLEGKTFVVLDENFKPYFYVLPQENKVSEIKDKIKSLNKEKLGIGFLEVEVVEKIWQGKRTKILKVNIDNPRKIPDVRDEIKDWEGVEETFEYDVVFYKRYIIDKQIEPMGWIEVEGEKVENKEGYLVDEIIKANSIKPLEKEKMINFKVLAFDTEFIEDNGKHHLIMLSLFSSDGTKKVITSKTWENQPTYVESVKGEKEIIEKFLEIVRKMDPDFICTYNGDNFDFPRLKERSEELKVPLKLGRDVSTLHLVRRGRISSARIKGRVHIDLFDFIDHILSASMKSEVLTLNEVAQELLGIGKKELEYKEMIEIWSKKEQMEKLAEYSLHDSFLTFKLSELILPQIFALCRLTGLLPFDACRNTYSQLVEAFYTRKAFSDNVLVPNRPKTEEIERRKMAPVYKGAIVIEPKKGIHSDILVFDFKSLYPTIICTHNISPETFNCPHEECEKKNRVPETNWHFCIKTKGFIPKHLEDLIKERQKIKKKMKNLKRESEEYKLLDNRQFALKTIANASYGYFGFVGAKWYKRECGASTAAFGRYYITSVIEEAKKVGFEIIYGDTDSLMVKYPEKLSREKLEEVGENFARSVNDKLPGIIELEFRGLYEGGIFVARERGEVGAKKRYALLDYNGNIEIRGYEAVRRDWCELSKKIQRDLLITVLKDKDPNKAVQMVQETIKKIKEGKVELEDLAIFEQITRPLSQYEQIGPHVKVAQKARDRGRPVAEGSVVGFVITKGKGSIAERAEPIEDVKPGQYDPDYYIHHQILPASMRVLKALGITEEEILSGKKQKRILSFYK
jgi:DNA polymerase I/DNA polymerase-2